MKIAKLTVLHVAQALGLFALARHLTRHRIRILCYHGGNFGDEHRFNPLLFCRAEHLDRRMRWLADTGFSIVTLSAAVEMVQSQLERPSLPTVLTFDDGWHSTYKVLGPVLARHQARAVLYLCTGYFASGQPVPDVTVGYLLWKCGLRTVSVRSLDPSVDGLYDLSSQGQRQALFERALRWVESESGIGKTISERLGVLARRLDIEVGALNLASRRFSFVDVDDVRAMRAAGWDIEMHGHKHHYPAGRPDELSEDLRLCRRELAKIGVTPGEHYCYPSGDHDDDAYRLLSALGVKSATTCHPGLVPEADRVSLLYLPRFLDGENIRQVEFAAEMSGFSDAVRTLIRTFRGRPARPA